MSNGSDTLTIVHTEASLGWGGQEIRILTEAAGMLRRGHRVTLLCPPEARIYEEALSRAVPVVALPIGRKKLRGVRALRAWFKTHPADVINTHSSTDTWLVALASLFHADAAPLVRTRHISSPVPRNWPTRWLYARATRHIVTTGEKLRQQLAVENGFDLSRMTSIPTGIDVGSFVPGDKMAARKRLGLEPGGIVVGIVATLRSWKGHRYLVDAFSMLADVQARLLIVGDGPQRQNLKDQVIALGLGDRVVMPGNQKDVLPWLQSMDVFVLPSYANEGVPQAIMQAMSCGLPVITTSAGSITEAVQHEKTGIVIETQNVDALHAAIRRLLAVPDERRQLGEAARAFALQRFGADRMLDDMEKVFRAVIASR
jgi:glycosyltransferase involved in cell wall biosynthesis